VWLTETARELVHHFKYEGLTKLGESAAAIMVRCLRRPSGVLVPVPLAPEKARSRGYNQAVVLAHALAARWRLQVDETVVQRTQSARSQTALTPHARRVNVSGAFVARRAPPHAPSAVILVDDILTTGATISAVAGALESAGWEHISAVTFARAMPYGTRLGLET
jgi:ComF family protein